MSAIIATFAAVCPECDYAIAPGDPIVFIDDTAIHESCEVSAMAWQVDDA